MSHQPMTTDVVWFHVYFSLLYWSLIYHFFQRREKELRQRGLFYIGCGVSGGEEGARYGPSLMPGGSKEAW